MCIFPILDTLINIEKYVTIPNGSVQFCSVQFDEVWWNLILISCKWRPIFLHHRWFAFSNLRVWSCHFGYLNPRKETICLPILGFSSRCASPAVWCCWCCLCRCQRSGRWGTPGWPALAVGGCHPMLSGRPGETRSGLLQLQHTHTHTHTDLFELLSISV